MCHFSGGRRLLALGAIILAHHVADATAPVRLPSASGADSDPSSGLLSTRPLRSLQEQQCVPQLLAWLEAPILTIYNKCIQDKANTSEMGAVGADLAIKADCWCDLGVKQLIEAHHCCDHPNWKLLCEMQCDDDCESAEAVACYEHCPAVCLEEDYAPDSCKCEENDCLKHARCIAKRGLNNTMAGTVSMICDDVGLEQSSQLLGYYGCVTEQPYRTNWHRYNSQAHCVCKENVKQALQEHDCCGAEWAEPLCASDCGVDCSSQEAVQCLEACRNKCINLVPEAMSEDCRDSCILDTSTCNKYKVCEPLEMPTFEYFCEDGSSPGSENGCCAHLRDSGEIVLECPTLCEYSRSYYLYPHGIQCQCAQCPATREETHELMNTTLVAYYARLGQDTLQQIANDLGMPFPAMFMQEMMVQRSEEIQTVIAEHGAYFDTALQAKISEIVTSWNEKIRRRARLHVACETNPADEAVCGELRTLEAEDNRGGPRDGPQAEGGPEKKQKDGGNLTMIAIIVGAGAVLLLAALGVLVMILKLRRSRGGRQVPDQATVGPVSGDSNVVVGRPVDPEMPPQSVGAAAAGAPVAASASGGGKGCEAEAA